MADRDTAKALFGWTGVDPQALRSLAGLGPNALQRLVSDPDPATVGAAAYRLAAQASPLLALLPVAWRQWSRVRIGLMVVDHRGASWQLAVNYEIVSRRPVQRSAWVVEIIGGPFDPGPTRTRLANPFDGRRPILAVVGGTQHRVAA